MNFGGFWRVLVSFGDFWQVFQNSLFVITLNDLIVKIFKSKDCQRPCLVDASIKQHLPVRGEL
jgi:hypothetical protein